jgi:hypothetical protein
MIYFQYGTERGMMKPEDFSKVIGYEFDRQRMEIDNLLDLNNTSWQPISDMFLKLKNS